MQKNIVLKGSFHISQSTNPPHTNFAVLQSSWSETQSSTNFWIPWNTAWKKPGTKSHGKLFVAAIPNLHKPLDPGISAIGHHYEWYYLIVVHIFFPFGNINKTGFLVSSLNSHDLLFVASYLYVTVYFAVFYKCIKH